MTDRATRTIKVDALARVEGEAWADVLDARIFDPLAMDSCEARPSVAAADDNTITQHSRPPGVADAAPIDPRYIIGDSTSPAGGISCSIDDLSIWAQFWLNEGIAEDGTRLLSEAQVNELWTGVTPQGVSPLLQQLGGTHFSLYGLGWTLRDFHGQLMVGHSGGLLGASSYFGLLPEEDIAVFVSSNVSTYASSALALQLLAEAAAGDEAADWVGVLHGVYTRSQEMAVQDSGAGDQPDVAIEPVRGLTAYTGIYMDPWYGAVSIEMRNGGLFIEQFRQAFCGTGGEHLLHHRSRPVGRGSPPLHQADHRQVIRTYTEALEMCRIGILVVKTHTNDWNILAGEPQLVTHSS